MSDKSVITNIESFQTAYESRASDNKVSGTRVKPTPVERNGEIVINYQIVQGEELPMLAKPDSSAHPGIITQVVALSEKDKIFERVREGGTLLEAVKKVVNSYDGLTAEQNMSEIIGRQELLIDSLARSYRTETIRLGNKEIVESTMAEINEAMDKSGKISDLMGEVYFQYTLAGRDLPEATKWQVSEGMREDIHHLVESYIAQPPQEAGFKAFAYTAAREMGYNPDASIHLAADPTFKQIVAEMEENGVEYTKDNYKKMQDERTPKSEVVQKLLNLAKENNLTISDLMFEMGNVREEQLTEIQGVIDKNKSADKTSSIYQSPEVRALAEKLPAELIEIEFATATVGNFLGKSGSAEIEI
ncbi:MAG: hypothetical protein COV36_02470 [Alphaproteobacteria bacterium CG11_big_fil_rev_8_21_14_0_20_44_7]|nr:MAG: hypothetical protein COV36_02470 [Alphaproteobacteria bacterium CG11_big_fil_rev_8_21_14_0_20_44_7]